MAAKNENNQVVLVFRKPNNFSKSIEGLFIAISEKLESCINIEKYTLPYRSTGLWKRVLNTLALVRFKKKIVHVTGDVHYALLGAIFCKKVLTIHDLSFLSRSS